VLWKKLLCRHDSTHYGKPAVSATTSGSVKTMAMTVNATPVDVAKNRKGSAARAKPGRLFRKDVHPPRD